MNAQPVQRGILASNLTGEKFMHQPIYKESWRRIEEANRTGFDFLVTDLTVGLTFLQIADVTRSPATRERDLDKALRVYRTVMQLLPRVILLADERAEIDRRLAELRTKLKQAGCRVEA
jgi:hypothetical protein